MSSKTSFHVRSNSLPSKPHPLNLEADEHLCRLRASSEATSSSSSSSSSHKLSNLCELYDCVDKLLQLPLTQHSLAQESHEKLLDGSMRLLDLCENSKDVLLQTKEFVYQLKSALRRRRSEVGLVNELRTCLISRKKIKKAAQKLLKRMERKNVEKNEEHSAVIGLLKEVESATFEVVKSFLSAISGSKLVSKESNWSIISRLVQSKRVASDDEESNKINEIDSVDGVLQSITTGSNKTAKSDCEYLRNSLEKLESSIQDFGESLENLGRQIIKIRVSILNIFNP